MDDFDFGFSLVDEDELEAVQKATVKVEAATTTSAACLLYTSDAADE